MLAYTLANEVITDVNIRIHKEYIRLLYTLITLIVIAYTVSNTISILMSALNCHLTVTTVALARDATHKISTK